MLGHQGMVRAWWNCCE